MTSHFFAAFFKDGVRRNNTSVMSAMRSGSVVITNFDEHSPSYFSHKENILDIKQLRQLPLEKETLATIHENSLKLARTLDWEDLARCQVLKQVDTNC
jgi:hypothetical protein